MNEATTRTKHFVAALDFSGIAPLAPLNWPKHPVKRIHTEALAGAAPAGAAVDATTGLQAEAGVEQAYIVGNQLVSFDKDVTERRSSPRLGRFGKHCHGKDGGCVEREDAGPFTRA